MITLYYNNRNTSSRRAFEWFRAFDIEVKEMRNNSISKEALIHILSLTENGFLDILKNPKKTGSKLGGVIRSISRKNFEEGVAMIIEYPDALRTPIIVDEDKLQVGYNSEDIRVFLPHVHRKFIKELEINVS